ncbi:MAG TPA: IS701 family transposase [Gemmataceae bacterium]|jgi:SRSO17 transposase|nr:IS701 family transposase [Gemmataceae bacterium]
MTTDQVQTLGPALTAFLRPFEPFFETLKTVRHFRAYTRGLLSDLPRKTAEPIAVQAGTPPRNLQQFLKACLWDHAGLTDAVQRTIRAAVADRPADPVGTVGIIDETSAVKKGDKTPGVQRQYLGCAGKIENGIVTVHLAVARGRFKALLDSALYLPESWDVDRDRCRKADIPDDLRYRPKWRIGLDLLGRAAANGWRFDWLTFDEGYGGKPDFLRRLDLSEVRYVGEVPTTFSCRPGRSRTAISAAAVFSRPGVRRRPARSFRIAQQTGPAAVWQVKVVAVALGHDRRPRHRLILARNRETGERKYFVTNAAKAIGVGRVLAAAFVRWNVEHLFRVAKTEVGLTHFEGRSYVSLMRHLALCLVVLAFVAVHTMRLRGEKSGGDGGAGVPGAGVGLPRIPQATAADR